MTHPLRGTCNDESCPQYGFCHCGCGQRTALALKANRRRSRTRFKPAVHRIGHASKVRPSQHQRVGKYVRNSLPRSAILPDFTILLRARRQKTLAAELGVSEGWVSQVKLGKITHIRPALAMRLAELARGSRAQAETEMNTENRRKERLKPPSKKCPDCGRRVMRDRSGIEYDKCFRCREQAKVAHCSICGGGFTSDHGLFLHALNKHGDRTQGRHSWAGRGVAV